MDTKGITLLELAVVLSVVVVLVSSLGISYEDWMKKYEIEKATKELYSDLMTLRVRARERGRKHFLVLSPGSYTLFEDKNGDGDPDPGEELPPYRKCVRHALDWNDHGSTVITCNKRGLIAEGKSVWFASDHEPDFDCVLLSNTRIIMGRHVIVREDGTDTDKCKID